MAVLPDLDRASVWADFMRRMCACQRPAGMTKADFRAAINAVDQWWSDNATTVNQVFPTAARNALTNVEKIGVFAYVALKRYGKEVV